MDGYGNRHRIYGSHTIDLTISYCYFLFLILLTQPKTRNNHLEYKKTK